MLTAVYHFEVSDLWLSSDLLGTRHDVTFGDYNLTLILPGSQTDFGTDKITSGPPIYTLAGITSDSPSGRLLAAEVVMIRVEVHVPGDLKAPPEQGAKPSNKDINTGISILRDLVEVAREFAQNYIGLARTIFGQYWLGPSESKLKTTWVNQLLDDDGNIIPVAYYDPVRISWHSFDSALSVDANQWLVDSAANGDRPELAESFLRDADYAATQTSYPDLRQAVLLAAIACEIKVKDTLNAMASPEQVPLLTLLLENPRDWSMTASSLFDKAARAICGRSLRDENRNLFKEIDLLFQDRNKIAHKGGEKVSPDILLKST